MRVRAHPRNRARAEREREREREREAHAYNKTQISNNKDTPVAEMDLVSSQTSSRKEILKNPINNNKEQKQHKVKKKQKTQ